MCDPDFAHMFSGWASSLSLTPCFSWVFGGRDDQNRFNGFRLGVETVETVPCFAHSMFTQLKQGANARFVESPEMPVNSSG